VRLLERDGDLGRRVAQCSQPDAIVAIAAEQGFPFTCDELRRWSRELGAPCWPWFNRGSAWRRAFFTSTNPT